MPQLNWGISERYSQFSKLRVLQKYLKDKKHNSLHLARISSRIFLKAHSVLRATLSLLVTDNACGQISECLFPPNGGYCLSKAGNCKSNKESIELSPREQDDWYARIFAAIWRTLVHLLLCTIESNTTSMRSYFKQWKFKPHLINSVEAKLLFTFFFIMI